MTMTSTTEAGTSGSPSGDQAPRRLSILGATGSIGLNVLDLVAAEPGRFEVEALTAGRNARELAALAIRFSARIAVVADPSAYAELRDRLAGTGIEAAAGAEAIASAAARPTDILVSAIVGFAGLAPSLAALGATRTLALANKETLVSAGPLFLATAQRAGTRILPVDSEHNAIFQVFETDNARNVSEVIITASGGPFRTWAAADIEQATLAQALKHPNWSMGPKITIDSATLFNKGLEMIEARWLFGIGMERIDVVVHPQSIIHSMVEFTDGSVLAQLSRTDMGFPIQYALTWPERVRGGLKPLDFPALAKLEFEAPRGEDFPALDLAREAGLTGGTLPAVFNAANEVAVEAFRAGRLRFPGIWESVASVMAAHETRPSDTLESVVAADRWARAKVAEICGI